MIVNTADVESYELSDAYENGCAYCVGYLTDPTDEDSPIEIVEGRGPYTTSAEAELDRYEASREPVFQGSVLMVVSMRVGD